MKTHVGSLQKKGNRYYLVIHREQRQQWIALKTGKLPLARLRAASIAPQDPDDEVAWLSQLIRAGDWARALLIRQHAERELTWESLEVRCSQTVDADATAGNRSCHGRWLRLLSNLAIVTKTGKTPGGLRGEDVEIVQRELYRHYLSAPRMLAYFRRVWRDIGLDVGIWPQRPLAGYGQPEKATEHYRRLTMDELVRLYAYARRTTPTLADMFLIGYSTGLRLSDVAELELEEVAVPFLRVCPNKTRRHKPVPLKIPLTEEAQGVVERLRQEAVRQGSRYLFASVFRRRPTRKMTAIFRACGIHNDRAARASFHSLRATFISLMDDAGVPPHLTDSITGHGGGGMHARYTQPSDAALLAAVGKAIPALNRETSPALNRVTSPFPFSRKVL